MTNLIIKRSVAAVIPFIVLGIIAGIFAFFLIYRGELGGWCLVPMATGTLLAGILGLRDNSPRLLITDSGLTVRSLGPAEIPWISLKSASVSPWKRSGMIIILKQRDGKKYSFYAGVLEIPASQILEIIKGRIQTKPIS